MVEFVPVNSSKRADILRVGYVLQCIKLTEVRAKV